MEQKHDNILWAGFTISSAVLAIDPIRWLVTSWSDPSYQSNGGVYGVLIVAIIAISLCSSAPNGPDTRGYGFVLFLLAAAVRLVGQMAAINIVSAFSLAIDVLALATFLRLNQRRLAVSPLWLSIFFLFCLPLAPILQRVAGFPLQMISADVACVMLSPIFSDLVCEAVRLRVNGIDVLVDLPCSGATGLLLMVSLWSALNVMFRPVVGHAVVAGIAIILLTIVGNGVRIALLAGGLALGIDTMEPSLHSGIGLISLGTAALPVVMFYRPRAAPLRLSFIPRIVVPRRLHIPVAVMVVALSIGVICAPRTALDVSSEVAAIHLPSQLLGHQGQNVALTPAEEYYFTSYGGTSQKAQFGPMGINIVRTTSPLRHLHSPEACLLGMGYSVRFLGTSFDPIPTSIYEATSPDGQVWHVAVSFVSNDGTQTAGVGEAIWNWLNGSSRVWQSVQRITPKHMAESDRRAFEDAALTALDL